MSKKATIIAVVNQKGGTGKTTTTENLGVGLALEGKKVLLVDTDPQASLTVSLGNPCPDDLSPTLSDLMGKIMMENPITPDEGILHHPEGVDLVPSNIELSGMEVALVNAMSRETILRQYLDTVKQNYDYILLDCMPSLGTLQWLFEQQYELTLTEVVEIRTRTTSSTDPETGETTTEEEDYEYYILNVKLRNKGLNSVISNSGLSEDDMERYRILLQTRGNRPDIFGNDIYATPGGEYTDYDIPGEALTDTRFANMIREAEKYLGYPYVWGGSSPSTSFDCSGFVSYVINHCGNGWSVGRLTANGLMGVCDIIPKSSAKPGDLIFFQGTYDTSGASHVGIYVGNGMMIHCGNPISYASIESNYWQQHFYCFGRIRN